MWDVGCAVQPVLHAALGGASLKIQVTAGLVGSDCLLTNKFGLLPYRFALNTRRLSCLCRVPRLAADYKLYLNYRPLLDTETCWAWKPPIKDLPFQ